jgi:hypothetical protein
MAIAFLNISLTALMPLFFAMPVELGGLGFDPLVIGYIIGSYGLFTGIFQVLCFSKITSVLSEHFIFVVGILAYLPVFMAFPVMNVYAQKFGITSVVWILIAVVVVLMTLIDMAFGTSAVLPISKAKMALVRMYFHICNGIHADQTFTRGCQWPFANGCIYRSSSRSRNIDVIVFPVGGEKSSGRICCLFYSLRSFRIGITSCSTTTSQNVGA